MSVYFGSAGISRTRYTLAGGLLAAFVSLAASVDPGKSIGFVTEITQCNTI